MDEFVRCPQCDDDLEGGGWEQHLGTHGYFKRPDAAVPKEVCQHGIAPANSCPDCEQEIALEADEAPDVTGAPSEPPNQDLRNRLFDAINDYSEASRLIGKADRMDLSDPQRVQAHLRHHESFLVIEAARLLALKENWDTYGAPIISKIAVDAALQLRNVLATVPSFVPMSNGGVQIEWHSLGFDIELEIQPNGRLAHPEPSDAAKLAFIKAHTAVDGEWIVSDKWEEALDAGLRAAYTVDRLDD